MRNKRIKVEINLKKHKENYPLLNEVVCWLWKGEKIGQDGGKIVTVTSIRHNESWHDKHVIDSSSQLFDLVVSCVSHHYHDDPPNYKGSHCEGHGVRFCPISWVNRRRDSGRQEKRHKRRKLDLQAEGRIDSGGQKEIRTGLTQQCLERQRPSRLN